MTITTGRVAGLTRRKPGCWARQGDLIMRRPFNEWTFTHMNRLLPAETVGCGSFHLPLPERPVDLAPVTYRRGARAYGIGELHRRTFTTAFVVLHHGVVVHEAYRGRFAGPGTRMQLFSVSKSILSLLVGIAIDQGAIGGIDDPVARYRPDFRGTAFERTTIAELLDMTSGVGDLETWDVPDSGIKRFERAIAGGDITAVVRSAPRTAPGGTRFNYSTFDSQVLGWVLEAATGQPLPAYASEQLWTRIGASDDAYYWLTRKRPRTAIGGGSFNATARDLARIGQLMVSDGRAAGEQVVPRAWVRRSMAARIAAGTLGPSGYPHYGYANHWWTLGDGAFTAVGVHGQYLFVDPAAGVVIVKCSAWPTQDDEARDAETIAGMREIARFLAGV